MRKNIATLPKTRETDFLEIPTDLNHNAVVEISKELRPHHLLLDEHAEQIFAMTDDIAERARKIGGTTLHSISDVSRHQRLQDNNEEFVTPNEMLTELCNDNQELTRSLRSTHEVCDRHNDVATASLIETWIDETERRTWFLSEVTREI